MIELSFCFCFFVWGIDYLLFLLDDILQRSNANVKYSSAEKNVSTSFKSGQRHQVSRNLSCSVPCYAIMRQVYMRHWLHTFSSFWYLQSNGLSQCISVPLHYSWYSLTKWCPRYASTATSLFNLCTYSLCIYHKSSPYSRMIRFFRTLSFSKRHPEPSFQRGEIGLVW